MDEGKSAKRSWWSRPRPTAAAEPTDVTPEDTTAFAAQEPARTSGGGPARADGTGPAEGHATVEGGGQPGTAQLEDPAVTTPGDAPGATAGAPVEPSAAQERPRPLHDPDPYGTPPYGEPGPWAPAPPVQHPGTPAQGTRLPGAPQHAGTPPQGVPLPSAPQGGTPAQGTRIPAQAQHGGAAVPAAPAHGTPGHAATPVHGVPAQGGPASGPPVPGMPEHAAPPHAPAHVPPQAPAPGAQPLAPGAGHWQQYDPWAAPFQQTGAVPAVPKRRGRLVAGAVALALVAGGIGGAIGSYVERNDGFGDVNLSQAGVEPKHRAPDSVAGIAASALPSVVTLHVRGAAEQGTGTGFVLDRRGHILTNNHVVQPAGSGGDISVTFSGGETAKARVVGRDAGYDLAVVKVSGVNGLKPLALGNSDNVQVGDPVVAIGAPFDLANTVTSGIISAKERPITAGGEKGDGSDVSYVDALQTDAPINPGNSGGPLVDAKARVIGINSAIRSADSGSDPEGGQAGSIGLGFAIPINQGKRVAEELINTGRATHPVIGVTLDMAYSGDGARVGTKGKDGGPSVTRGGPGDKAGIRAGDVITGVDGQQVHSGEELIIKIRAHRPGDRLQLTLERGGHERKITLTLGSASGT
ncbi:trypsin-like peptidase domain-containing protein [Streptomyces sp. NPDC002004]